MSSVRVLSPATLQALTWLCLAHSTFSSSSDNPTVCQNVLRGLEMVSLSVVVNSALRSMPDRYEVFTSFQLAGGDHLTPL